MICWTPIRVAMTVVGTHLMADKIFKRTRAGAVVSTRGPPSYDRVSSKLPSDSTLKVLTLLPTANLAFGHGLETP